MFYLFIVNKAEGRRRGYKFEIIFILIWAFLQTENIIHYYLLSLPVIFPLSFFQLGQNINLFSSQLECQTTLLDTRLFHLYFMISLHTPYMAAYLYNYQIVSKRYCAWFIYSSENLRIDSDLMANAARSHKGTSSCSPVILLRLKSIYNPAAGPISRSG